MTLGLALLLLASGVAAGLFGALLGLGGGVLIVPILVLVARVPMHHAIAASLLCVIATSSAAASRNVRSGVANVRLGMALELFTVLGALAGSAIAGLLPSQTLMVIFAVAMVLMSILMLRGVPDRPPPADPAELAARSPFARNLDGSYFDAAIGSEVTYQVRRLPLAAGVSSAAGILSGLLGIGGGLIKVPALTLFCGVPMKASAATSNFVIGVTAVASAWVYYGRGEVSPGISAAAVIGVFVGSRSGSILAGRIHGDILRKVFAAVMVVIAIQLVLKAFGVYPA